MVCVATLRSPRTHDCFPHFLNVAYECYNPAVLFWPCATLFMPTVSRGCWRFSHCSSATMPLWRHRSSPSLSTVSVQCLAKAMFQKGESKANLSIYLFQDHSMRTCWGQRSDSSTHSSHRPLDESGELHVPDKIYRLFVTFISHCNGKTGGLDAEIFASVWNRIWNVRSFTSSTRQWRLSSSFAVFEVPILSLITWCLATHSKFVFIFVNRKSV